MDERVDVSKVVEWTYPNPAINRQGGIRLLLQFGSQLRLDPLERI